MTNIDSLPQTADEMLDDRSAAYSDTEAGDDSRVTRRSGSGTRLGRGFTIAASAVVLVALLVGMVGIREWRGTELESSRDRQVLDTARTVATDLVTVGSEDPQGDLERILEGTTGTLRQQFADAAEAFTTVLGRGEVSAVGEVPSVAIVDADDDRATVIAAVVSTVSNTEVPDGQRRVYRMELELEHRDGRWAVATMEVLP